MSRIKLNRFQAIETSEGMYCQDCWYGNCGEIDGEATLIMEESNKDNVVCVKCGSIIRE